MRMYPLGGVFYSAYLREKTGELRALRLLDEPSADRLLPILVALPLTAKENQFLTPTEVVKREVGRVQTTWKDRVCVWDSRYLIFDGEDSDADTRLLDHLLAQFAAFGARVIPMVGLRESYHRTSCIGAHAVRTGSGVAIRIEFGDIEELELLTNLVSSLRLRPVDCIIVVDFADADTSEHDEFAKSLVRWLYALRGAGNWARIVTCFTSFPLKNPAPPEGSIEVRRQERDVWEWALRLDPKLPEFVIFGDFGADNARFQFEGGGRPIPHLRYLKEFEWLVARGDKNYGSVRGVSQKILKTPAFRGREFSAGDEFIADCAAGLIGTSDPTQWRAVNMNHHMTAEIGRLARLYGVEIAARRARTPYQPSLFDAA